MYKSEIFTIYAENDSDGGHWDSQKWWFGHGERQLW